MELGDVYKGRRVERRAYAVERSPLVGAAAERAGAVVAELPSGPAARCKRVTAHLRVILW